MTEKIIKTSQEQATASWINYLNQIRLDSLFESLSNQNKNYEESAIALKDILSKIELIGERGGTKGIHGFIAEVAECGIGNARELIKGNNKIYEWINDNGPTDLLKDGVQIQQKFVNSGNNLSLQAIKMHLQKYPDFLKNGGKYQIPKDHFEKIKELMQMGPEQANKLSTENGNFQLRQWKFVNEYFKKENITIDDIEPSTLNYNEVQANTISDTIEKEREQMKLQNERIKEELYLKSKPSVTEGLKIAGISATLEGGIALVTSISKKYKTGKRIKDFNSNDWNDVIEDTSYNAIKGSIRGTSIYVLTNYTATPAAVASAICSASFGIAEQAYLLRHNEITEYEFMINAEQLCIESSISALSSFMGQAMIPIPVLGAIIGNTIGILAYQIAKENLTNREQAIIEQYLCEISRFKEDLEYKNILFVYELNEGIKKYYELLNIAFLPNCIEGLNGSVKAAIYLGVSPSVLLKSYEDLI